MNIITKHIHLPDIIDQINSSLEHENYIAALALALTIPDKCGKIEYPELVNGKKRYIDWYNTWCHTNDPDSSEPSLPDANGKFIYQLRCAILHESSTELNYSNLEEKNKLDEFDLILADFNDDGIYVVFSSEVINNETRSIRIRLIDLCKFICYTANIYYEENKEKVDAASNIKIIDTRTK